MENNETKIEYKVVEGVLSKVTIEPLDSETKPASLRLAKVQTDIHDKEAEINEAQGRIDRLTGELDVLRTEESQLTSIVEE